MSKKISNKKRNLLISLLLAISATCILGACKDNGDRTDSIPGTSDSTSGSVQESMLHLQRTALSVLIYEDVTLAIEEDYSADELIWESSDVSIATVENGHVMTKKAGVVNITVSYGEYSDTCVLTIEETTIVPALKFNVDNATVSLNEDFQYELMATLTYNAKEYQDIVCVYESADTEIATVSEQGVITAVKEGNTQITVTVNWRGVQVVGQVDVCVVSTSYISLDKSTVEIYAACPKGYDLPTSAVIVPTMISNDEVVENVAFTLKEVVEEGDASGKVAVASGNSLTAVGVGTAKFVFTCEYNGRTYTSEPIIVTVSSVVVELKDDLYATKSEQDLYVDVNEIMDFTSLDKATVNGEEKTIRNKKQIQIEPLENGTYEVAFSVDGDDSITYKTQLFIADKLISSVSDLKGLDINGYYVVTQDIDCKGAEVNHLFTADNWYAEKVDNGFQGVFDGNGHTISNISVDSCGLFGNIGSNAVVKNLGLYNVTTRNSGYGWAMGLAMYVWGTVENVSYYQAESDTLLNSVIGAINGANIKNFVVYAPNESISGFFNSLPKAGKIENVYVFSGKINGNSQKYSKWYNSSTYAEDADFLSIDFSKIFDLSDMGIWLLHRELNIPLIRNVVNIEDESIVVNQGEDVSIENSYFDEVLSVSLDGVLLSADDYIVDAGILTIKSEYLETVEKLNYDICSLVVETRYAIYTTTLAKVRGEVLGATQEYVGMALSFSDNSFADVRSVKVNGVTIDSSNYTLNGTTLTLNKAYLDTLTKWENTLTVETPTAQYIAKIEIYTYINTLDDLFALTGQKGNPYAYYKLTTDLDAKNYAKTFGKFYIANWWTAVEGESETAFQGVFDGQGHTISNIKVAEFGLFGTIGVNGVVKNVGFYNVNSVGTHATIDFGIATDLYGTLENVSYYQDEASDICAIVGRIHTTSVVNNFVGYVGNAKTCGFINTNSSAKVANFTNVYVISNVFNNNSSAFSTDFLVDSYKTDEAFTAIDFASIFDCSATGMWTMNESLGIPLI